MQPEKVETGWQDISTVPGETHVVLRWPNGREYFAVRVANLMWSICCWPPDSSVEDKRAREWRHLTPTETKAWEERILAHG